MWEQLGPKITRLEWPPPRGESVAASFRQLLRAHEADDEIAAWFATHSFSILLRLLLQDLLSCEVSWGSKGRWLDKLDTRRVLFRRPLRVRMLAAVVWSLLADVGGPQWADPFEADLALTADLSDLAAYTIRFGDRREFPGEGLQGSRSRIERDIESGAVEWEFVWSKETAVEHGRGVDA